MMDSLQQAVQQNQNCIYDFKIHGVFLLFVFDDVSISAACVGNVLKMFAFC